MRKIWIPWVLVAIGCGAAVDEGSDESSSSSSGDPSTSAPTTSASSTVTSASTSASTSSTSTSTTDEPTSTTQVDPDTSSSGDESSTGDPPGTCVGISQYESLGSVLARDGTVPGDPACDPAPAPCGGDLVGTWDPVVTCGTEAIHDPFAEICPGSGFVLESIVQEGSLTFVDDGTFSQSYTTTTIYTATFDAAGCFGATCADIETTLAADGDATCTGPDDACDCTVTVIDDEPSSGSYEIVDDTIVLTVNGQSSLPYPFCVEGDRLDLWPPLTEGTLTETSCQDAADCEAALGDRYEAYACVDVSG